MPKITANTIQVHIIKYDAKNDAYFQLILRRSPASRIYQGLWQVVTGRIEQDEISLDAAIREVFEETSLSPEKIWNVPYIAQFFNVRLDEIGLAPIFAFLVGFDAKVVLSDEHTEFRWIPLDSIGDFVKLPSHIIGTKTLKEYIINNPSSNMFLIRGDL